MTDEEIEEQMRKGEHDEDPYEKEGREELVEEGEMDPSEAAFMQGYEEDKDREMEGEDEEEK